MNSVGYLELFSSRGWFVLEQRFGFLGDLIKIPSGPSARSSWVALAAESLLCPDCLG